MPREHDVPLLHTTFTLRNPRNVLLLQPFQLFLVLALATVAVVFTIWPEALDHSPVSFERRGLVHHVWHYSLLAGSVVTLAGMLSAGPRRLRIEFTGLCLLVGVLGVNLVACLADASEATNMIPGLDVALRAAVISGLAVRAYIIAAEPTVNLRSAGGE